MCAHHALLPKAFIVPVSYDRTKDALYSGGYADVWKGTLGGRDVAVKVIRTYSNSALRKITKVGVGCTSPRALIADDVPRRAFARRS